MNLASASIRAVSPPAEAGVSGQAPNVLRIHGMVSISRMIFATVSACMLAFLAGCVMHQTYGDPELAESELAVVEGYWHYLFLYDEEMHIVSVDGKRKSEGLFDAYSVSLPSGKHWLQLSIKRNSGDIARCAFEWQFDAKHRYKMNRLRHDQFLLAHPASSPFKASISMEVTAPAKPVQLLNVPAICAKEALCRQNSDCSPNDSCQSDAGLDFGTCKPRDR